MKAIQAALLVAVLAACGGGGTSPSPIVLQPTLVAVGSATFHCPGAGQDCTYGFQLTNQGPGCGVRVRGSVELRNAAGAIFAVDGWELPAEQRLAPQATVSVTACCVKEVDTEAAVSVRIVAQADAVSCQ